MLKVYRLKKAENANILLNLGKLSKRFEFTGGNIMANTPATYATHNTIEQLMLDEAIANGYPIELVSVEKVEKTETETAQPAQEEVKREKTVVEEAVTVNDAIDWLKDNGVKGTQLKSVKSILQQCEALNVEFPNVNFAQ